jgi:hypothetical protein
VIQKRHVKSGIGNKKYTCNVNVGQLYDDELTLGVEPVPVSANSTSGAESIADVGRCMVIGKSTKKQPKWQMKTQKSGELMPLSPIFQGNLLKVCTSCDTPTGWLLS